MTRADYHELRLNYLDVMQPWVEARVARRNAQVRHPVWDFLFEYYPFKPGHLLRFSPGAGVPVAGVPAAEADWPEHACPTRTGFWIDPARFPVHRHDYLEWAIQFLQAVSTREPFYGCFGLHEWAMLYQAEAPRHEQVPLRLGRAGTNAVVESAALRCTHFDAFRFFTPAAAPRNRIALRRVDAPAHDQPGCVHANMDLYKLAFKIAPFVSSATLLAAFQVATEARQLDMRASPYDLTAFGFAPICIETRAGRDEYMAAQRDICAKAAPVRAVLLSEYRALLAACRQSSVAATHT